MMETFRKGMAASVGLISCYLHLPHLRVDCNSCSRLNHRSSHSGCLKVARVQRWISSKTLRAARH